MEQYLKLLKHIKNEGVLKEDRTGTGTKSVFGYQMRFDLQKGFPMVTTKKLHLKSIIYELLWFIKGDTNTKYLTDNGVRIWNEWANENGDNLDLDITVSNDLSIKFDLGVSYNTKTGLIALKGLKGLPELKMHKHKIQLIKK